MEVAASWERLLDLYHSVRDGDRPPRRGDGALLPRVCRRLLDLLHVRGSRARHRERRAPVRRDLARRPGGDHARRRARSATTTASACSRRRTWPASTARPWRSSRPRSAASIPTAILNPGKMGLRWGRMTLRSELIAAVGEAYVSDEHGELPGLRVTPGSAAEVAEVIRRAGTLDADGPPGRRGWAPRTPRSRRQRAHARVHLDRSASTRSSSSTSSRCSSTPRPGSPASSSSASSRRAACRSATTRRSC